MDLVPKKRKPRRTEGVYEVDPDGDTYIILHNANAPFAVWDPKRNNWPDLMAPDKSVCISKRLPVTYADKG